VIHPKVKAFRDHVVVVMEAKAAHQGSSLSSHISDRYCASQSFVESLWTSFHAMIELGYDNIQNKSYRDMEYWQTVSGIAAIMLTYYGLVKLIFRDYSSLVNICVGIILYKVLQSVRVPIKKNDTASTITNEMLDDDRSYCDRLSNVGSNRRGDRRRKEGTDASQQREQPRSKIHHKSDSINDSKSFISDFRRPDSMEDSFEGSNEFWYSTENKRASFRPRIRPYRIRTTGKSGDMTLNMIDHSVTVK